MDLHDLALYIIYQPGAFSWARPETETDDSCVRNLNSRQFRPTVNQLIFEDLSREIGRNVQIKETKYLACSILGELRVCICICISSEMRSRFSRVWPIFKAQIFPASCISGWCSIVENICRTPWIHFRYALFSLLYAKLCVLFPDGLVPAMNVPWLKITPIMLVKCKSTHIIFLISYYCWAYILCSVVTWV